MDVGDVVGGKYELVRLLGQGGMGAVYEARHTTLGRRVAIKLLRPEMASNTEVVVRFLREARAAASIGSDHIVQIIDVADTSQGEPYLVMEYLEGDDLATILHRDGILEPSRAVRLVRQVCSALALAHDGGIVHRDLKPENVFVVADADGTERIKILDFGVALFNDPATGAMPRLTATGAALGTPYYMAPEQAKGARDVDLRADVYSAGVMLYEVLTGRPPFQGESFAAIVIEIATAIPPTPSELRPGLRADLEAVVLRAMARERHARHPSMRDLSTALEPFADPAVHTAGAVPPPTGEEPTMAAGQWASGPFGFGGAGITGGGAAPASVTTDGAATASPTSAGGTTAGASTVGSASGPAEVKRGSSLGLVIGIAAVAALVVGGGGTAAIVLSMRGCDSSAPTAVVSAAEPTTPTGGTVAATADPQVEVAEPTPLTGVEPAGGSVPPVGAEIAPTSDGEGPAPTPTGPTLTEPTPPATADPPETTKLPPATKSPPPVKAVVERPPPQKRPAAEALAEARSKARARDYRGCIQALRNAEKSPHVIAMNIRCHDRGVGRTKACELARRCPSIRWCQRFVHRQCR